MKKVALSCIFYSFIAFALAGCNGIHVSFDSDNKPAIEEVNQEQSAEDNPTVNVNINGVPQPPDKPDVIVVREPPQRPVYTSGLIFWNSDHVYLTKS